MYGDYFEELDFSNDDTKRACIDALRNFTNGDLVGVLLEAVRTAHARDNIRKEDFWAGLFVPTGNGMPIRDTQQRQGYPNQCPSDAYNKLDSQAWLKYLLFGNSRVRNGRRLTDSRSYFSYFNISIRQGSNDSFSITDNAYKDALHAGINCRNLLFAHENPAEFNAVTFEKIIQCCENMRILLRPLCVTDWPHQVQSIQLYNKVGAVVYEALGDAKYTIPKLMLAAGIPGENIAEVKALLSAGGFEVNGDKVTLNGDPNVFVDALNRSWFSTYSVEGKVVLLKALLPAFEQETVNALVQNAYGIEQLSESALDELVDAGSAKAQHEKANRLLRHQGNDWEESHKAAKLLFETAANAGLPEAQSQMAQYMLRENDPEKIDEVKDLLARAKERKDPHSYFVLGEAYLLGRGVGRDEKTAYEMFCQGAELGDGPSKADKVRCELYGIGTSQDELALNTMIVLAENEPTAASYLARYYYDCKKYEKAMTYARMAADHGLRAAQYLLGLGYYHGLGVEKDERLAMDFLSRASVQGHTAAMTLLAKCCYTGKGTDEDREHAAKVFEEARSRGVAEGSFCLGICYYVDKEYDKAFYLFSEAAEKGNGKAYCMMGECYYNGYGVTRNYVEAANCLKKAADDHACAAEMLVDIYSDRNKYYNEREAIKYCDKAKTGYIKIAAMYIRKLEGALYDNNHPDYKKADFYLIRAKANGEPGYEGLKKKLESGVKGPSRDVFDNSSFLLNYALKKADPKEEKPKIRVVFPED